MVVTGNVEVDKQSTTNVRDTTNEYNKALRSLMENHRTPRYNPPNDPMDNRSLNTEQTQASLPFLTLPYHKTFRCT